MDEPYSFSKQPYPFQSIYWISSLSYSFQWLIQALPFEAKESLLNKLIHSNYLDKTFFFFFWELYYIGGYYQLSGHFLSLHSFMYLELWNCVNFCISLSKSHWIDSFSHEVSISKFTTDIIAMFLTFYLNFIKKYKQKFYLEINLKYFYNIDGGIQLWPTKGKLVVKWILAID